MDKRTEEILNKVYNLILDTDIYKMNEIFYYIIKSNRIQKWAESCHGVVEALRQQAVSGIHGQKSLSPKVCDIL